MANSAALIALRKMTPSMEGDPTGEPAFPLPSMLKAFRAVETVVRRIGTGDNNSVVEYRTTEAIRFNVEFHNRTWWHCILEGEIEVVNHGDENGGVSFICDPDVHALLFILEEKEPWL